jgi:hypothetical protein
MTPAKATRMGFAPAPFWEMDRFGLWVRFVKRPVCTEVWNPKRPDVIERSIASGIAGRSISWRKA